MIVEGIINIVYNIVNIAMTPFALISFVFDVNKLEPILQYFKMALYLIPYNQLIPIIVFFITLMSFRIAISLLKTIWNILPIV